jgi:hypothetical protein
MNEEDWIVGSLFAKKVPRLNGVEQIMYEFLDGKWHNDDNCS